MNRADALHVTTRWFRNVGENYHARMLEEQYIFPEVRKTGRPAAGYVDTLLAQHRRGRELTDDMLTATQTRRARTPWCFPAGSKRCRTSG